MPRRATRCWVIASTSRAFVTAASRSPAMNAALALSQAPWALLKAALASPISCSSIPCGNLRILPSSASRDSTLAIWPGRLPDRVGPFRIQFGQPFLPGLLREPGKFFGAPGYVLHGRYGICVAFLIECLAGGFQCCLHFGVAFGHEFLGVLVYSRSAPSAASIAAAAGSFCEQPAARSTSAASTAGRITSVHVFSPQEGLMPSCPLCRRLQLWLRAQSATDDSKLAASIDSAALLQLALAAS